MAGDTYTPKLYVLNSGNVPVRDFDPDHWTNWMRDNMKMRHFSANGRMVKLLFLGQDPMDQNPPKLFEVFVWDSGSGSSNTKRFTSFAEANEDFNNQTGNS